MSSGLDPDQDQQNASPDLGPNSLQRLLAGTKVAASKEIENTFIMHYSLLIRPLACGNCRRCDTVRYFNIDCQKYTYIIALTLKAPRKKSIYKCRIEVVCCKLLPNITDKLSFEANSVDPDQTAPIGAV